MVREGLSEEETPDLGIWKKRGSEPREFPGGKASQAAFWSAVRAKVRGVSAPAGLQEVAGHRAEGARDGVVAGKASVNKEPECATLCQAGKGLWL